MKMKRLEQIFFKTVLPFGLKTNHRSWNKNGPALTETWSSTMCTRSKNIMAREYRPKSRAR